MEHVTKTIIEDLKTEITKAEAEMVKTAAAFEKLVGVTLNLLGIATITTTVVQAYLIELDAADGKLTAPLDALRNIAAMSSKMSDIVEDMTGILKGEPKT